MNTVYQAVFTAFSLREPFYSRATEPLSTERLARRLSIFEFTTLPALLGQSMQSFDWFVFVDEALPTSVRARLQQLVARRERSHIVVQRPEVNYHSLAWLRGDLPDGTRAIATTLLDDDDTLHRGFMGYLRWQIDNGLANASLPPIRFFACERSEQWDLVATPDSPLGRRKPWSRSDFRGRPYPPSPGFTVCVHCPGLDVAVPAFEHSLAPNACRFDEVLPVEREDLQQRLQQFRGRIAEGAQRGGVLWRGGLSLERNYRACTLAGVQAVATNHIDNLRQRIDEQSDHAQRVTVSSFGDVPIDFELAARYLTPMPDGQGASLVSRA